MDAIVLVHICLLLGAAALIGEMSVENSTNNGMRKRMESAIVGTSIILVVVASVIVIVCLWRILITGEPRAETLFLYAEATGAMIVNICVVLLVQGRSGRARGTDG